MASAPREAQPSERGPASARAQAARVLRIVTYSFSPRDTCINGLVLLSQLCALCAATSSRRLSLSSLFWLPFALLIGEVQLLACLLTGDEGFSMLWCALVGLMLYEHAVHQVFSGPDSAALPALAIVGYTLAAAALVYYAAEEVSLARRASAAAPHGEALPAACWRWCGSTSMHALSAALGAALVALADLEDERRAAFWIMLASALLLLLLLLVACRCRPPHSRVHPVAVDNKALSDQMLRLEMLQMQLTKCREELTLVRLKAEDEEQRAQAARDGKADGDAEPSDGKPRPEKVAASGMQEEQDVRLRINQLEAREGELLRRIDDAAALACAAVQGSTSSTLDCLPVPSNQ
ncbi:hypothetical protein AB1Y20_022048 [Prymnesium parvum]|uniref:Uncharacterized protein n=1 Tax=Prymnesium parvum TaxID=97485 RepID=A0AB34JGS1_PRYPA